MIKTWNDEVGVCISAIAEFGAGKWSVVIEKPGAAPKELDDPDEKSIVLTIEQAALDD